MFSTSLLRLSANYDGSEPQEAPVPPQPQHQPYCQPAAAPQPVYPQQPLYYMPYSVDNLTLMQYNLLLMQQQMHAQRQAPQQLPQRSGEPFRGPPQRPGSSGVSAHPQSRRGGSQQHLKKRSDEEEEEIVEDKISLTGLLSRSHQTKEEVEKWVRARRHNFPTRENIRRKEEAIERDGEAGKMKESELSILEVKLRKKLMIMDYNPYEEKRLHRERKSLLHRINSGKRLRLQQAQPGDPQAPDALPRADRRPKKEKKAEKKALPGDPADGEEPRKPRAHTPQDIIDHLQSRRLEDGCAIESFIHDKPQTDRFKYQQNTLLSHLLLDDVYRERSTVLQAIRHLVKNNFLQQPLA